MDMLEFIAYLSRAYNLPAHVRVERGEWEIGFGADEHSMLKGTGKTPAEALAKILELR